MFNFFQAKKNLLILILGFSLSLNVFFLQKDMGFLFLVDTFMPPPEGWQQGTTVETGFPDTPHKAFAQKEEISVQSVHGAPQIPKDKKFCDYKVPETPEYKGEFIYMIKPDKVEPNELFRVKVYVKNNGTARWFSDYGECEGQKAVRLGTLKPENHVSPFWTDAEVPYNSWIKNEYHNRIVLLQDFIDPGEVGTFVFWGKAPAEEDIYREIFGLNAGENLAQGQWMADPKVNLDIVVGNVPAEVYQKIKHSGISIRTAEMVGDKSIEVNLSEQKLYMKYGEKVINSFYVSSGAVKTPTPQGTFHIINKQPLRIGGAWPHYRMPNFMAFTNQYAGFHALPYLANDGGTFWTEALNHIGRRVSHGCIRVLPWDAEVLYDWGEVGIKVWIHN